MVFAAYLLANEILELSRGGAFAHFLKPNGEDICNLSKAKWQMSDKCPGIGTFGIDWAITIEAN